MHLMSPAYYHKNAKQQQQQKKRKERKKENTFDDPTMVLYQACGTAQLYKLASINLFKL